MRALVTGATGFIGGHVARALAGAGHLVRVLVRGRSDRSGLAGVDCEAVEGDLRDAASLTRAVEGCDLVCHLAALMSTRRKDKERMFEVNVAGTTHLWNACLAAGAPRVLYAASIFALGGPAGPVPVDETVAYNLGGLDVGYFQSRRAAELDAWRFAERGLPILFLYPGYCFGPGDVYLSSTRILYTYLKSPLPIYPRGGLNAVDVRDVAQGFALAAVRGHPGERYLLGGVNVTFRDLFAGAARAAGQRRPSLPLPSGPTRLAGRMLERMLKRPPFDEASALLMSRYWYYDSSKARRELAFTTRPLEQTLADAVADLRARGLIR